MAGRAVSAGLGSTTRWIGATLRWGSYLSALLLLVGVAWILLASDVPIQAGPPMPLAALGGQLAEGNPYAVMQLGLMLLLATPLVRVAVAGVSFWLGRERRYTLLALGALAVILLILLLHPGR